jgi:5-methyltetrahydrofolate--homocysteine methyltransferase
VETLISSRTKTVVIGPERPFTIIGERINPTGRKKLAAEMAAGDFSRVQADALAQVAAGARVLDVNAGIPLADEAALLAQAIQLIQSITDAPLSIDSSVVAALARGLEVYQGKALVNSVTGEEERLEAVLPLVKKHGAAVIGISNDETGISMDPCERFKVAKKIVQRAMDHGIPRQDVLIDPLVMPAGAVPGAGRQVFEIVRRVREELGVNTVCGASNVSFGLPNRTAINAHFLSMAIAAGMTAAITNPCEPELKHAIMAADLLMGHDQNCAAWIAANRASGMADLPERERRRSRRRGVR